MHSRRKFLQQIVVGGGLSSLCSFPWEALAGQELKLTILHTNDTHSRLEPFPMDDRSFAGQGGVVARATAIAEVRKQEEHVILLDAGDIFQGTPYFNEYLGEPEMKAMSMMGYDAATMGNHDFDIGIDGFLKAAEHANFPFVVANYDVEKSGLKRKIKPYTIIQKGPFKIGVFGLGIQLSGLVPRENYKGVFYQDPVSTAIEISHKLKHKEKCDLVICLSHLGYEYSSNKVSDRVLAAQTEDIDLIIGGHTHTFLESPVNVKNRIGKMVIINQVGWAGLRLGRIDFTFTTKKAQKKMKANTVILGK